MAYSPEKRHAQYLADLADPIRRERLFQKRREGLRRWRKTEKGKKYMSDFGKKWRAVPSNRTAQNFRVKIDYAIRAKRTMRSGKAEALLGCTIPELKRHIESLFLPGMSWSNRSSWHIDHIRPCSAFDLTDPEQQRCCFHYSNLQPLWPIDNILKSNKVTGE